MKVLCALERIHVRSPVRWLVVLLVRSAAVAGALARVRLLLLRVLSWTLLDLDIIGVHVRASIAIVVMSFRRWIGHEICGLVDALAIIHRWIDHMRLLVRSNIVVRRRHCMGIGDHC